MGSECVSASAPDSSSVRHRRQFVAAPVSSPVFLQCRSQGVAAAWMLVSLLLLVLVVLLVVGEVLLVLLVEPGKGVVGVGRWRGGEGVVGVVPVAGGGGGTRLVTML